MKAKWFNIRNFRSIIEIKKCHLSPNITVLAGKNESGKSNVLEALSKFDLEEEFSSTDKPLYKPRSKDTEITFCFEINGSQLNEIMKEVNIDLKFEKKDYEFLVTRSKSDNDQYTFSGDLDNEINKKLVNLSKEKIKQGKNDIKKAYQILKKYRSLPSSKISFEDKDDYQTINKKSTKFVNFITEEMAAIKDNLSENEKQDLDQIIKNVDAVRIKTDTSSNLLTIHNKLDDYIPNIILFKTFEDILPYEIELAKASEKKIIKDFYSISDLDVDTIQKTTDGHERRILLDSATATLEGDFKSYWKQDKITLKPEVDGTKLRFFFYDEGESTPFKPEQRSKGFQWFLSFYITLKAKSVENEGKGNIILIDEPGFYLHAKAQHDVLDVLEDLAKDNQVIFTTHMPYLIDPNKLDRIRLVLRDQKTKQTKLENSISKGADFETLTPIITAIGLDISKGLGVAKEKNVILEGISDYYYIQIMKKYLQENNGYEFPEDIYFIPSVGADKIPMLVPLFIGWDLKYSVVLDSDRKGNEVKKKLIDQGILEENIIFVKDRGNCIEDLFSQGDFRRHVLQGQVAQGETRKNSEIIKDHQNGKSLTAKLFHGRLNNGDGIQLNQTTVRSFTELFDKIKAQFQDQNQ